MKSRATRVKMHSLLAVLLGLGSCLPALAQDTTPAPSATGSRSGTSRATTLLLTRALERLSKDSGMTILADSTVAYERVPVPESLSLLSEEDIEKELTALIKALPPGTVWGKLYLPPPPAGRTWKGDDVAAFTFAQARLFGKVGAPSTDGSIEILGKRVAKEVAPTYTTGLGLKPIYLFTNTKRQIGSESGMPWSTASPEQWANMSREERMEYGRQQAAWIMSLPTEQREQMLERIRQHDKYFDTVKDPLEKLLGHDL